MVFELGTASLLIALLLAGRAYSADSADDVFGLNCARALADSIFTKGGHNDVNTDGQALKRSIVRGWYQCWKEAEQKSSASPPKLRVLVPRVYAPWLLPTLARFEELYGVQLDLNVQEIRELLPHMTGDSLLPPSQQHAVWLQTTLTTQHLADMGLSTDLSRLVELSSSGVHWTDVFQLFRLQLASYQGRTVSVPLDGTTTYTIGWRDVLHRLGMQVPRTWRALLDFILAYPAARQATEAAEAAAAAAAAAAEATKAAGAGAGPLGELPRYPICIPPGASCRQLTMLQAIWSSLSQTRGSQQGVHFDTSSGEPLLDTPPAREAFRILAALLAAAAPLEPDEGCSHGSLAFARGRCALVLAGYVPQFRLLILPEFNATVRVADLVVQSVPGSDRVWVRGALSQGGGRLAACDEEHCPYGTLVPAGFRDGDSGQGEVRVNHTPLSPGSNLAGAVNSRLPTLVQYLAFELLAFLASPDRFLPEEQPPLLQTVAPIREHLVSNDSLGYWQAAGYDRDVMAAAMTPIYFTRRHPNRAWDLRMPYYMPYNDVLAGIVQRLKNGSVVLDEQLDPSGANTDAAIAIVSRADAWASRRGLAAWPPPAAAAAAVTPAGGTGRRQLRQQLQGFEPATTAASPPKPSAASSPSAQPLSRALREGQAALAASYDPKVFLSKYLDSLAILNVPSPGTGGSPAPPGSSGDGNHGLLPLVLALVVSGAALVAGGAAAWVLWRRQRRKSSRGSDRDWLRSHAESSRRWTGNGGGGGRGVGPGGPAAIVVTDIQDSTALWEALPAAAMSEAVQLHHGCIRRLLLCHGGYESSTEGDSFILAFRTIRQAVAFATELQAQLLQLPWPEVLLQHESCTIASLDLPDGFPLAFRHGSATKPAARSSAHSFPTPSGAAGVAVSSCRSGCTAADDASRLRRGPVLFAEADSSSRNRHTLSFIGGGGEGGGGAAAAAAAGGSVRTSGGGTSGGGDSRAASVDLGRPLLASAPQRRLCPPADMVDTPSSSANSFGVGPLEGLSPAAALGLRVGSGPSLGPLRRSPAGLSFTAGQSRPGLLGQPQRLLAGLPPLAPPACAEQAPASPQEPQSLRRHQQQQRHHHHHQEQEQPFAKMIPSSVRAVGFPIGEREEDWAGGDSGGNGEAPRDGGGGGGSELLASEAEVTAAGLAAGPCTSLRRSASRLVVREVGSLVSTLQGPASSRDVALGAVPLPPGEEWVVGPGPVCEARADSGPAPSVPAPTSTAGAGRGSGAGSDVVLDPAAAATAGGPPSAALQSTSFSFRLPSGSKRNGTTTTAAYATIRARLLGRTSSAGAPVRLAASASAASPVEDASIGSAFGSAFVASQRANAGVGGSSADADADAAAAATSQDIHAAADEWDGDVRHAKPSPLQHPGNDQIPRQQPLARPHSTAAAVAAARRQQLPAGLLAAPAAAATAAADGGGGNTPSACMPAYASAWAVRDTAHDVSRQQMLAALQRTRYSTSHATQYISHAPRGLPYSGAHMSMLGSGGRGGGAHTVSGGVADSGGGMPPTVAAAAAAATRAATSPVNFNVGRASSSQSRSFAGGLTALQRLVGMGGGGPSRASAPGRDLGPSSAGLGQGQNEQAALLALLAAASATTVTIDEEADEGENGRLLGSNLLEGLESGGAPPRSRGGISALPEIAERLTLGQVLQRMAIGATSTTNSAARLGASGGLGAAAGPVSAGGGGASRSRRIMAVALGAAGGSGTGAAVRSQSHAVVFRGLRVRVGITWSQPTANELQYNAAAARMVYGGPCVAACKAVADMAHGGQVVMSTEALAQLEAEWRGGGGGGSGGAGRPQGLMILHLGTYALPRPLASGERLGTLPDLALLALGSVNSPPTSRPPPPPSFCELSGGLDTTALGDYTTGGGAGARGSASCVARADCDRGGGGGGGGGGSCLLPPESSLSLISGQDVYEPAAATAGGSGVGGVFVCTSDASLVPLAKAMASVASGNAAGTTGTTAVAAATSAAAAEPPPPPPERRSLYLVTSLPLMARLALVPRPRMPPELTKLYELHDAPVGRLSYVVVQIPAVGALLAWDRGLTEQALRVFEDAANAQLQRVADRGLGYRIPPAPSSSSTSSSSAPEQGRYCLAFTTAAAAVWWAEGLRLELLQAPWPRKLLSHELCEVVEATAAREDPRVASLRGHSSKGKPSRRVRRRSLNFLDLRHGGSGGSGSNGSNGGGGAALSGQGAPVQNGTAAAPTAAGAAAAAATLLHVTNSRRSFSNPRPVSGNRLAAFLMLRRQEGSMKIRRSGAASAVAAAACPTGKPPEGERATAAAALGVGALGSKASLAPSRRRYASIDIAQTARDPVVPAGGAAAESCGAADDDDLLTTGPTRRGLAAVAPLPAMLDPSPPPKHSWVSVTTAHSLPPPGSPSEPQDLDQGTPGLPAQPTHVGSLPPAAAVSDPTSAPTSAAAALPATTAIPVPTAAQARMSAPCLHLPSDWESDLAGGSPTATRGPAAAPDGSIAAAGPAASAQEAPCASLGAASEESGAGSGPGVATAADHKRQPPEVQGHLQPQPQPHQHTLRAHSHGHQHHHHHLGHVHNHNHQHNHNHANLHRTSRNLHQHHQHPQVGRHQHLQHLQHQQQQQQQRLDQQGNQAGGPHASAAQARRVSHTSPPGGVPPSPPSGPVVLLRGLRMRAGIASGMAECSLADGSHALSYSGRPVLVAAKLAEAAASSQVLCDETTRQEALAEQMWAVTMEVDAAAAAVAAKTEGAGRGRGTVTGEEDSAAPGKESDPRGSGTSQGAGGAGEGCGRVEAAASASAVAAAADRDVGGCGGGKEVRRERQSGGPSSSLLRRRLLAFTPAMDCRRSAAKQKVLAHAFVCGVYELLPHPTILQEFEGVPPRQPSDEVATASSGSMSAAPSASARSLQRRRSCTFDGTELRAPAATSGAAPASPLGSPSQHPLDSLISPRQPPHQRRTEQPNRQLAAALRSPAGI